MPMVGVSVSLEHPPQYGDNCNVLWWNIGQSGSTSERNLLLPVLSYTHKICAQTASLPAIVEACISAFAVNRVSIVSPFNDHCSTREKPEIVAQSFVVSEPVSEISSLLFRLCLMQWFLKGEEALCTLVWRIQTTELVVEHSHNPCFIFSLCVIWYSGFEWAVSMVLPAATGCTKIESDIVQCLQNEQVFDFTWRRASVERT